MFRFGMRFEMPEAFDRLQYYGRGPGENYADRKSSAFVGLYRQSVDEQFHPYIRPQETGTKSDLRWWHLADIGGRGLTVTSDAPFSASALHYPQESLDEGPAKRQGHSPRSKSRRTFRYASTRCSTDWRASTRGARCRCPNTGFPTPTTRSA